MSSLSRQYRQIQLIKLQNLLAKLQIAVFSAGQTTFSTPLVNISPTNVADGYPGSWDKGLLLALKTNCIRQPEIISSIICRLELHYYLNSCEQLDLPAMTKKYRSALSCRNSKNSVAETPSHMFSSSVEKLVPLPSFLSGW